MLPTEECIIWWIRLRERSTTKKKVVGLILATCIYVLWNVRNVAKNEFYVSTKDIVIRRIKSVVIRRLEILEYNSGCMNTNQWLERLKMGGTG